MVKCIMAVKGKCKIVCSEERGSNEKCGKDARFFEEKESLIKRIKIAVMNILK